MESRQGKAMNQPKEKRYPTDEGGLHIVNQISFIGSHFTGGLLWFHFLCFHFLLQQPQGRNISEWPNPTHQHPPGVHSGRTTPFSPSTTSWHHWSLQALLSKLGSPPGFTFLQINRTGRTVQLQWSSAGSPDQLHCFSNSLSVTFCPCKQITE